jgi:hypothetical protein
VKQGLFAVCAVAMTGCTTQYDRVMAEADRMRQESQDNLARLQREADEQRAADLKQTQACILAFPNLKIGVSVRSEPARRV